MTTWISKPVLAVTACFALTACDALPSLPVLDSLSAPDDAPVVALSQSKMANGAFTLVPPQGFCIDKSSLKQRFALMARCDTLGIADGAAGAPVGIITASVTPVASPDTLPSPTETADALKLARVTNVHTDLNTVTFRAEGIAPSKDMDPAHWRGTVRIGGHLLGIAIYGPKNGRAVSAEGLGLMNSLIRRSREATDQTS